MFHHKDRYGDSTFTIKRIEEIPLVATALLKLSSGWHIIRILKTLGTRDFGPNYVLAPREDPIYHLYHHIDADVPKEINGLPQRVYVIVTCNGRAILQSAKNDKTGFDFVSGGINPGEDNAAAAMREVSEELGIEEGVLKDLGFCHRANATDIYYKPEDTQIMNEWHYYSLEVDFQVRAFTHIFGNKEVKMITTIPMETVFQYQGWLFSKSMTKAIPHIKQLLVTK